MAAVFLKLFYLSTVKRLENLFKDNLLCKLFKNVLDDMFLNRSDWLNVKGQCIVHFYPTRTLSVLHTIISALIYLHISNIYCEPP